MGAKSWAVALAAICFAGCHGVNDHVTSGTRLRARWEVADGARRLIGWHDRNLDVDCTFDQSTYDAPRCLPATALLGSFLDASCTQPAVTVDASQPIPVVAMSVTDEPCAGEPQFFRIGADLGTTQTFIRNGDGACIPGVGTEHVFAVGAPIPVDTFAVARAEPDDAGQLWLVSDDGAQSPRSGWDGTRAVAPAETSDGTLRWGPWRVAFDLGNQFADAQCQVPLSLGSWIGTCAVDAVLTWVPSTSNASPLQVAFWLPAPPPSDYYVHDGNGACTLSTPMPDRKVYGAGARIADAQLLPVGVALEGGAVANVRRSTLRGRAIQMPLSLSTIYGQGLQSDRWIDVASGLDCAPLPAADGKTRCLPPPTPSGDIFFADAECRQPLGWLDGGSSPPPLLTYRFADGLVHAWPVTQPTSRAQVYYAGDGGCMPYPSQPSGLYDVGPELPPERFAEITIEID